MRLKVRALSFPVADTLLVQFEPMEVEYLPGQHLTLLLQPGLSEIRRSYSLCSLPTDPYPAIAITRVANGEASRWLHDQLKVGDLLESLAPSGRFLLETAPELVFLAAGSGITPIYPLIRQALTETSANISLYYSEKEPRSTLFYEELLALQAQQPERLNIHWHFSQVVNRQTHFNGRLNQYVLEKAFTKKTNKADYRFYACGPHSFLRLIRLSLQFMGYADGQIKRENFASEGIPLGGSLPQRPKKDVTVRLGMQQYHQSNHITLLEGARQAGIQLPYSCGNGQCGTCTIRLKHGQVLHRLNEVLTDKELTEGYVLSCTAYPESDRLEIMS